MTDIYYKASSMDAIAFSPTVATLFMSSGTTPSVTGSLNDPAGAKQNLDPTTGLLVLAATSDTNRYWHNWVYLPAPPAP
jgi:hypothetical protein